MRTMRAKGCQRDARCRTAWAFIAAAIVIVLSVCVGLAQTHERDPASDHNQAIDHFVKGNADISRGDTRAALQNYLLAQSIFERLLAEEARHEWQRELSVLQEK